MTPLSLPDRWRSKAVELRGYAAGEATATAEECTAELEEEPLTMAQGPEETGYTDGYLYRVVKDGTIPNAGEHGAPRIRPEDTAR